MAMENKPIVLKNDELAVIKFMREHGPHVDFTVEKRPDKENPDGKIVRVVMSQSILVGNMIGNFDKNMV